MKNMNLRQMQKDIRTKCFRKQTDQHIVLLFGVCLSSSAPSVLSEAHHLPKSARNWALPEVLFSLDLVFKQCITRQISPIKRYQRKEEVGDCALRRRATYRQTPKSMAKHGEAVLMDDQGGTNGRAKRAAEVRGQDLRVVHPRWGLLYILCSSQTRLISCNLAVTLT